MLGPGRRAGKRPCPAENETVSSIKTRSAPSLAGGVLISQRQSVPRRGRIDVSAIRVQRLRKGIGSAELEAVAQPLCQTDFQGVVPRTALRFHLHEGVGGHAWNGNSQPNILGGCIGPTPRKRLIKRALAYQVRATRAHISNFSQPAIVQLRLNIQRILLNHGGPKVRCDSVYGRGASGVVRGEQGE